MSVAMDVAESLYQVDTLLDELQTVDVAEFRTMRCQHVPTIQDHVRLMTAVKLLVSVVRDLDQRVEYGTGANADA